ncbi:hypothetical protein [Flavobacterium sp.]|jgi:hypothetical protein|uniref:hypothetical protein n=1 Tax=Flavobacterium sp. TaxID=239 RepID=UPI0037C0236C
MKKLTLNNILWLIVLIVIGLQLYDYVSDSIKIKNYKYGKKYNANRASFKIPLLTDAIEPLRMYVDEDYGMIWINENNETSDKKKLIHKIKIIEASKENGWISEKDVFLFYKNESLNYNLEINSKIENGKVNFVSFLKIIKKKTNKNKVDTENNKMNLNISQLDSLRLEWGIK